MKNKFIVTTALFLSATLLGLNLGLHQAIAQGIEEKIEAEVTEDDLNNLESIPWGGDDYPYSKVTKIVDTLAPEYPVGYVVMDRHGIDNSDISTSDNSGFGALFGGIVKKPFTEPVPGKEVYISLWGAKAEGCFVQLIVQLAPKMQLNAEQISATKLELGVGGRKLELVPQPGAQPQVYNGNYSFTVTQNGYNVPYTGVYYVSKMLFGLDGTGAQVLMNAPAKNVKARITMPNNTIVFEIGKKTVERWKTIYSVNPTCENLNATQ